MKRRNFILGLGLLPLVPMTKVFGKIPSVEKRKLQPLFTGISDFDKLKGGFHPGELTLISGSPSVGKTSFAVTIANNLILNRNDAREEHYYSIEQSKEQIMYRLLAQNGRLSVAKVRAGHYSDEEFTRLVLAAERIADVPFYINDTAAISTADILQNIGSRNSSDLKLILVDYVQLMKGKVDRIYRTREEELHAILRDLKLLSLDLKVPIVALAMHGRRQKINVPDAVDSFITLSRDSYNAPDVRQDQDFMRFLVLKNNHGAVGSARCAWSHGALRIG